MTVEEAERSRNPWIRFQVWLVGRRQLRAHRQAHEQARVLIKCADAQKMRDYLLDETGRMRKS